MNIPDWVEYTGSDEQIEEIKSAKSYLVMGIDVSEECSKFVSGPFVWVDTSEHIDTRIRAQSDLKEQMEASNVTHYLICQPHPYADLIKIWAGTGCPVYAKSINGIGSQKCHEYFPPFAHPDKFEYQLTPFED